MFGPHTRGLYILCEKNLEYNIYNVFKWNIPVYYYNFPRLSIKYLQWFLYLEIINESRVSNIYPWLYYKIVAAKYIKSLLSIKWVQFIPDEKKITTRLQQ